MNYPLLAWALLERGEQPAAVVAFLCDEYGLDVDQAEAALVLARHLGSQVRDVDRAPPVHGVRRQR